eukprot:1996805-Alexandrium_andersonii.AAC.1
MVGDLVTGHGDPLAALGGVVGVIALAEPAWACRHSAAAVDGHQHLVVVGEASQLDDVLVGPQPEDPLVTAAGACVVVVAVIAAAVRSRIPLSEPESACRLGRIASRCYTAVVLASVLVRLLLAVG